MHRQWHSAPPNIVVDNDTDECDAVVTYSTPTFNDNCGGLNKPGSLVLGLPSGSEFPLGTTTVEYWYFDASGNGPAVCSFNVTVNDTQKPKSTCPANVVVGIDGTVTQGNATLVSSGPCGVTLSYNAPAGTDNCDNAVTANTGGLGAGPNVLRVRRHLHRSIWQVTDAERQHGDLFVHDNGGRSGISRRSPALPNVTLNNDLGECDAAVTYSFPYFGDNCPNYTLTQNYRSASGEEFVVGTTTVSFTVKTTMLATRRPVHVYRDGGRQGKACHHVLPADRFVVNTNSNGAGDCSGAGTEPAVRTVRRPTTAPSRR
jgi:hypothetical protein